nr:MAG TPA: hypothetical protein [Caudoviricetes sp.]
MDKIKRPKLYTLPDTLRRQSSAAAAPIVPAWPVWYRVQTGAACPASGRVCQCVAWSALHLARPALLPVLCSLSGCAGAGVSTCGVYSRHPAPPGQSRHHRKNKKGSKNHPTPISNLKNSAQK